MTKPRALTSEEGADLFLRHLIHMADYWAQLPNKTPQERTSGLLFSVMTTLDGSCLDLPAFTVTPNPHKADKAYDRENGENWWNKKNSFDGVLHERLVALEKEMQS